MRVAGDTSAIAAVFDAAVRAGWGYLGDLVDEPMFTSEDWVHLVADHMPPSVLLVATDESGAVVGYAAAHPDDSDLFLLFVHPTHAGMGVGRTLLTAAHDALQAAGCAQAFLFVHEQNERAIAVYTAACYRPDGTDRVSDFRGRACASCAWSNNCRRSVSISLAPTSRPHPDRRSYSSSLRLFDHLRLLADSWEMAGTRRAFELESPCAL